MMRALVIVLVGTACTGTPKDVVPHGSAPPSTPADAAAHTPGPWGATVTAPGGPVTGDVVVVDGTNKVIAHAPIANGRYELPAAPAGARVVARFEAPVIGVRDVPIVAGTAPAITIAASEVVTEKIAVELPAKATVDWVELELTPTEPAPTIVLWSDPQGGLRGAMVNRRLTSPAAEISVLRGSYRINASRIVENDRNSFALDHVVQHGTDIASPTLAGPTLTLDAPGELRFFLRRLRDSER